MYIGRSRLALPRPDRSPDLPVLVPRWPDQAIFNILSVWRRIRSPDPELPDIRMTRH